MSETIGFAKSLKIKEAGKDERWLHGMICDNPACLGLGNLGVVKHEKIISSGGRLDILLQSLDYGTMYEVEIMLGKTDESHIIRTIEYWDKIKRKWPDRAHRAVLVAEEVNNRFFNVIHLLSGTIPIIAIQVSLVEVHGHQALFFTKVLDVYEEENGESGPTTEEVASRDSWEKNSKWTVETADSLKEMLTKEGIFENLDLRYTKEYVAIVSSNGILFTLRKRSENKSKMWFRGKEEKRDELTEFFEDKNISYGGWAEGLTIKIDKQFIEENKDVIIKISEFIKDYKGI